MKPARRNNRRKAAVYNARGKSVETRGPAAVPVMDEPRRDAPSEVIDLSTNVFQTNFPDIAESMANRRRAHEQRRKTEQAAAPGIGESITDT